MILCLLRLLNINRKAVVHVTNFEFFSDKKAFPTLDYHPKRQRQQHISRTVHQFLPHAIIGYFNPKCQ